MAKNAPGQHRRKGLTSKQVHRKFATEAKAETWFVEQRWSDGIDCPREDCGSDNIATRTKHKTMPYRCRACRRYFSVRTGTPMADSNLPLSDWGLALYFYSTNLKGMSSMKLHRELGITQKAAWHMAHRIREMFDMDIEAFQGPVEADETYIGGSDFNRPEWKRSKGRGSVGKTPVAGLKDRDTGMIKTRVIEKADQPTLGKFISEQTQEDAMIYTDEHAGYNNIPRPREWVKHSANEYVRGEAHTQGLEGFWSHVKRGIDGVYHWWSVKHIERYLAEFEGRFNLRPMDTIDMMGTMVMQGVGKRLRYCDLIASEEPHRESQIKLM